jgi:hypothetical protein
MEPPRRRPTSSTCNSPARKAQVISLDDPDIGLQLGRDDPRLSQGEFIDEIIAQSSPSECAALDALVSEKLERSSGNGEAVAVRKRKSKAMLDAQAKLQQKCREILIG